MGKGGYMSHQPSKLSPMCCELVRQQAALTHSIMEATWRRKIFNEDVDPNMQDLLKVPFNGLNEGLTVLNGMTEEIEEVYNFLNNPKSKAFRSVLGEELEWRATDELTTISTGGLSGGFIKSTQRDFEALVDGTKPYAEIVSKYSDPVKSDDIYDRFFSSSIPSYVKLKRLSGMNNVRTLVFTEDLVRQKLLHWIVDVMDCKLRINSGFTGWTDSSFAATLKFVKVGFTEIVKDLKYQKDAARLSVGMNGGSVTKEQVDTLYTNICRCTFSAEAKLVVLIYRAISATIANIRHLYELYVRATKWDTGIVSENFAEEFEDDGDYGNIPNLSVTNSFLLTEAAKKLIHSITNVYSIAPERYTASMSCHVVGDFPNKTIINNRSNLVDLRFYNTTIRAMQVLEERVLGMITDLKNNTTNRDFSAGDYKLLSNPEDYLIDFVKRCNPIPPYSGSETTDVFLGDLDAWLGALGVMKEQIESTLRYCQKFKDAMSSNVNGAYDHLQGNTELTDWFTRMQDFIGKLNVELGFMMRKRLAVIAEKCKCITPFSDVSPEYEKDETPIHVSDGVDEFVAEEEADAERALYQMNQYYANLYRKKLQGLPYMEEEEQKPESTTKPDDKSGNGKPKGPVVHDNAVQNDDAKKDENTENKDGEKKDGEENSGDSGKIVDKLLATIKKVKEFLEKIATDKIKEKNLKFLADNKTFLLTRNYTNTSVEVYPYTDNYRHIDVVRSAIEKAVSISEGTLKSSDESGIRNALFPGVSFPSDNEGTIQDQLVRAFKVGEKKLEHVTISDGQVKDHVVKMVEFLEYHYNKFENDVGALEENVKKLSILDDKKGSGEGDKTDENVKRVRDFLVAALSASRIASRDRCNDALDLLLQLAAPNKNKKTETKTETDQKRR